MAAVQPTGSSQWRHFRLFCVGRLLWPPRQILWILITPKTHILYAIRIVLRPSLKADTHRRPCSCHLVDMCSDSELAPGRTVFPLEGNCWSKGFPPDALPDANLFAALGWLPGHPTTQSILGSVERGRIILVNIQDIVRKGIRPQKFADLIFNQNILMFYCLSQKSLE
jgi:hypothetical protein